MNDNKIRYDTFTFCGKIKNKKTMKELIYDEKLGYIYNITGSGTIKYDNGLFYEGDIKDGKFHGSGKMIYSEKPLSYYDGKWANGMQKGNGSFKSLDGWICKGSWENAVMNGECSVTFPDGSYYKGNSENTRIVGKGELYDSKKHKIYAGEWLNEQFNGYGIYYHKNGREWYRGNWKNNLCHGEGEIFDEDGCILCRGFFENGIYIREGGHFNPIKNNARQEIKVREFLFTPPKKKPSIFKKLKIFSLKLKKNVPKILPKVNSGNKVEFLNPIINMTQEQNKFVLKRKDTKKSFEPMKSDTHSRSYHNSSSITIV